MILIISLISAFAVICNACNDQKNNFTNITHPNGLEFAGSETCKSCHKNIFESQSHTAHALSSLHADSFTVKGSFENGKNIFALNGQLKVVMQKEVNGLWQVAYINGQEAMRQPMDMVIGSGTKGQTYLYWHGNILFQLPVSYYTPQDTWCNSPGFPGNQLLFNRVVPARCLECHSTYAETKIDNKGIAEYDKTKMIYGISCERCHGPAAKHAAYHINKPQEKIARYIVPFSSLSRQQKLDNCALCHSGLRQISKPLFSFVVGDKLDDYSAPDYKTDTSALLDVHGNQYGLLTASKCFMKSNMDCSSCHNTHQNENSNLKLFSSRCMNCHSASNHNFCTLQHDKDLVLENNCIDCHMPSLPSKKIFLNVAGRTNSTADLVRTHYINVYKGQTKLFMQKAVSEK